MREVQPDRELLRLLDDYHRAGGAIDYALIDVKSDEGDPAEMHRQAAVFGMQIVDARWRAFGPRIPPVIRLKLGPLTITFDNLLAMRREKRNPKLRTSNYYWSEGPLTFQLDRLTGERITPQEFMGSDPDSATDWKGYEWAFADPPYPLKSSGRKTAKLFDRINRQLFGRLDEHSAIYRWSTDWCSYFDDGRAVWGAFLWTVQNPNAAIAWIGASASD